jgi:FkbM family methyltransferase
MVSLNSIEICNAPIFLFGAGGAASWVLNGFRNAAIKVEGFLDEGAGVIGRVAGVPVLHPDSPALSGAVRADAVVVFAVMNPAVDEPAIRQRLQELGWRHVLSIGDFGRRYYKLTGRRCGMLPGDQLDAQAKELAAARRLLNDDESRAVFDAFITFMREVDDSTFPPIAPAAYFPPDLPRWSDPLRIIDCGGFDGDTLRAAQKSGYRIEASASFEPDPKNFSRLSQSIRDIPGAQAWPCGVSDRTELMRFSAQGDRGSSVSALGEISIQCVTLDEALPHFAPNLIKFDIEGSEEAALRGAERLLRSFRPGLAVSVYHLPTDIWRLPLFISSVLGPRCVFNLRRHSRAIADTVLYVHPYD